MRASRSNPLRAGIRDAAATLLGAWLLSAPCAMAMEPVGLSSGQRLYVPVYSRIYLYSKGNESPLAATLSVRNTDGERPIVLEVVDYHDTGGARIRSFVDGPVQLAPLETAEFVIGQRDKSGGGTGANFIVVWRSEQPVTAPIVETVMIGISGNRAIAFTSHGRVVAE